MQRQYTRFFAKAIFSAFMLQLTAACAANAAGVAQQLHQQSVQPQYQQHQYQQPQQQYQYQQQYQQPQYIPQDNDETYRLPGQYSPTLNDLRRQFPAQHQQMPQQYQYRQYDQNDSGHGNNNYYYQ